MMTVNIRKQGGSSIITIPAAVLKPLNIGIGSTLELTMTEEGFVAYPIKRKRYTLKELFRGTTPENMKSLHQATESAREGQSVGRELV